MKYKLQDLIDIEQFQILQDRLNEIYSFPSAIIDNDGNVLSATAWQDICTKFHRKNKECERDCIQSDQYILSHLHEANPAVSYCCPRGMVDSATPIIIDGIHYGNFFTGQFFFQKPDMEFFRTQAQKYGFEEDAYIEAVKKVPIWTQEKLNSYLFFIKGLIAIISESGLKNLKEIETRRQIEESEERANTILRQMQDGFWMTNLIGGQSVDVNEAMCRMLGYTRDEMLKMSAADLEANDSPEVIAPKIQHIIQTGSGHFESRLRRKDGTIFDVEVSVTYLPKRKLFFGFYRDISESKRAEEALRESEEKHRILVEESSDPIFSFTPEGQYKYVNRAFAEGVGKPVSNIIGKKIWDVFPQEEADKRFELLSQAFHTGEAKVIEVRVPKADGDRYYVTTITPIKDPTGEVVSAICSSKDITERKRSERALEESETKLRSILDNIRIGVALISSKMEVLDLNHQMREWFPAIDPGQHPICYRAYNDPPREEECDYCPTHKTLQDGLVHEAVTQRPQSGVIRNYRIVSSPILNASGGVTAAIEMVEDITEKLSLESQLHQSQKMESVGRLAGGVAHDFNNMLSAILGHVELALDLHPAQPLQAHLEEIKKAARRSADLTRQLLAFARKQTVAPKVLDLNETIEGMLKMLRRLIGEDIRILWHPDADLWPVKVDPSQIDQILANLCVNARDAIADVGKVTIETGNSAFDGAFCANHPGFVPGEYVQLTVSDDGCGMDRETLAHIFEPFFTTKGVGQGTGLGLAMVYGTVKQNDGFVNANSEPGQGTTFSIYLPRHAGQTGPNRTEDASRPTRRGHETILLVEDEPAILGSTTAMLERQGYIVRAASTPGEAIRLAREHAGEIHLLMTDVVMPEMNGRDLAKNLLSLYPHLKRLFMSGYTANVIAHHGVLDEGVHFLQKPFSINELAEKIRETLDSK